MVFKKKVLVAEEEQSAHDNNGTEIKVKDKYRVVYILFYALGVLTQLQSHFFITANDYWMYKFRDPFQEFNSTTENRTSLQAQFTSSFSTVSNAALVVFVVFTLISSKWIDIPKRITASLTLLVSMFILTLTFVLIDTDSWQTAFFGLSLTILLFLTAAAGMFLVTIIQLGMRFPPEYLPTILTGQAMCGTTSAIIQIISLSVGVSSTISAVVYFTIGISFVLLTTLSYYVVSKTNNFYKVCFQNKPAPIKKGQINMKVLKGAFDKIKWYNIAMLINQGASTAVHPAVTSLVVSAGASGNSWEKTYFVPVSTFLLQHLFDLFGRELGLRVKWPVNGKIILILSVLKIVFVPLFMLCNAQPRSHLPVVFDHDYDYIILIIFFSLSTGYIASICIYQIPNQTEDPVEKVCSYMILMIVLMVGVGLLSFVGVALVDVL